MRVNAIVLCIPLVLLSMINMAMAEESLSAEFLDFFVEFEGDEGEWMDPEELDAMIRMGNGLKESEEENTDE